MDPTTDPRPEEAAASAPPAPGELIVQNGRLSGVGAPLRSPVTVIGQAPGCDIRLDVAGVQPLHCLLIEGPTGLVLRDLHSTGGTLVNDQPAGTCLLQDGDILDVGPFRFLIRLPDRPPPLDPAELERDRDALRIQAAAVAAQQAALTEEELRLQQRRTALEQQEAQLATHLEERRRQLSELRDQARQARSELQTERAAYEQRVAEAAHELACGRREVADGQALVQGERRRLSALRGRLKRRWHRHWAAERATMRRREAELAAKRRALETEAERLQQARAMLNQARLRCNGDVELGRRQLRAAWDDLHQQQEAWQEQRARQQAELEALGYQVRQREAALAEAEERLCQHRLQWQEKRLGLEKELEGLENRVANQRRKLGEQEQELLRLGVVLRPASTEVAAAPVPAPSAVDPGPVLLPVVVEPGPAEMHFREAEARFHERVAALEAIVGDLADQRLHLAEQCQRLVQTQHDWQHERDAAAAQLELVATRLQERELALAARERSLGAVEGSLHQRHEEAALLRRQLEAWQGRLTARATAWEAERDRLLAEARSHEELAGRRLALVAELRQRWHARRRRQLDRLRAERAACANLRQECAAARAEWLGRRALLDQEQRALADQALGLEQYRQEVLGKVADPAQAAQQLEGRRRRWSAWTAAAERPLVQERLALLAEAARLQARQRELQQLSDRLDEQEADWSHRQASREELDVAAEDERARLRERVDLLSSQRSRYEQQIKDVSDEIERLVGVLLAESTAADSLGQAA
jgi:hypothetical protein